MTSQKIKGESDNRLDLDKAKDDKETKQETVEYDDLLSAAGEFGWYQLLLFFSTLPFYGFGVFVYYSQLFMTEVSPNHWCRIPELENLTVLERRHLGIPKDDSIYGYSQCEMYSTNWTEVLATGQKINTNWSKIPCKYGWEFNDTEIPYPTISSEFGWVCDKSSYQANAQALFFLGSITGGFIVGWVSDRFGRLPALVLSNLLGCAGGVVSTFARNIVEFAVSRFFMGMAFDNCMMMAYLLMLECTAPKYRTLLSNSSIAVFYSLFVTVLPWIALACGHWKTLSLVTSVPLALAIFTPLFVPESPRWLLSKGRVDTAINKVLVIGRINRKNIPEKLIEKFKLSQSERKTEESKSFLEILKRPVLRKIFLLICLEYMCCAIVFDGLMRSIGQLDFDFFLSFSLISFTELPSMLLVAFVMDWMGRRMMTIIMMFIACLFSILTTIGSGVLAVIFAVIARFSVNMTYSVAMQWAPELLPTSVRGSGASVVHICGYLGTVISPYIVYLKIYIYWLPMIVIGLVAALGALVAFGLPETAQKDMPHTFDDAEALSKKQRIWTMPCLEKKNLKKEMNHSSESDCHI